MNEDTDDYELRMTVYFGRLLNGEAYIVPLPGKQKPRDRATDRGRK